jgi:Domain of unknown function (DUF4352)
MNDRSRWQWRLLSFFVWSCLVGLIMACSGTFPTVPKPDASSANNSGIPNVPKGPGKIGERVDNGTAALTVSKVSRPKTVSQPAQRPPAGKEFLQIDILGESTGKTKVPYSLFYFSIKDSKGEVTAPTIYFIPNQLNSTEVNPGDKLKASMIFAMDPAATGLVLKFGPITTERLPEIEIKLDK